MEEKRNLTCGKYSNEWVLKSTRVLVYERRDKYRIGEFLWRTLPVLLEGNIRKRVLI